MTYSLVYILIFLTIFWLLDDEESVQDTISTADNLEDDNFSLSEIKPDDRARREEIIETLIEHEIVNLNQAQKISNIKVLQCSNYIHVLTHMFFFKSRVVWGSENPVVIRWA